MRLVEIIATSHTEPRVLDQLETWLTSTLGKGVIRALDTPTSSPTGSACSILAAMHHTARLGLGFDEVDALTGPKIGCPKSATYRTADVVGLDTLAHVIGTMDKNLADDPLAPLFQATRMAGRADFPGALGQKAAPASSQGRPRDPGAGPENPRLPPRRRQAGRRGGRDPQGTRSGRRLPRCAPAAIRRPSSCGACSATSSTTAPRSWPTWPTMPATWTWPCAGLGWAQGPFETAGRRLATDRPGRGR